MNLIRLIRFVFLAVFVSLIFISCEDTVESEIRYEVYEPVYLTDSELENSVKKVAPKELESLGKIYIKGYYIFINEPAKGIHVIDNRNPTAPVNKLFIEIPGNYDISIKDNLLYADNATDLVVMDIRDIENPKIVSRVKNVFNEVYPEGMVNYFNVDQNKGVIVDWEITEVVEKYDNSEVPSYYLYDGREVFMETADFSATNMTQPVSQTGTSGSLARFKIYDDYLYALERQELHVFDISDPLAPAQHDVIYTNWLAETLFIRNDELFVGTRAGMQIYSLTAPESPVMISSLEHWTACDPVVVEGDYAYVTLRSGSSCNGINDELQVIDISVIEEPTLINTVPMSSPYGLGISNSVLFICDGNAGLKVYDASNPMGIENSLLVQFPEIHALDVIPLDGSLLMIGDDGLYQYDYTDINNIKQISHLSIR